LTIYTLAGPRFYAHFKVAKVFLHNMLMPVKKHSKFCVFISLTGFSKRKSKSLQLPASALNDEGGGSDLLCQEHPCNLFFALKSSNIRATCKFNIMSCSVCAESPSTKGCVLLWERSGYISTICMDCWLNFSSVPSIKRKPKNEAQKIAEMVNEFYRPSIYIVSPTLESKANYIIKSFRYQNHL
jgi:hypothetical protein